MPITHRRLASLLAIGLATGMYGCGDGLVLPENQQASAIEAVSGNGQSGTAGSALGEPLVVRVTDAQQRPVEGQGIVFEIESGQGAVSPDTARTNSDGQASTAWTLGSPAGAQQLQARAFGNGVSGTVAVKFNATALAGTGSTLALVSGDGQTGPVRSALADSLVVKVSDAVGNPVSGVEVLWTAPSGGGSISPASVTTGADGLAAAERVLGPSSGTQTAQAAATGLAGSPVTFTHTAEPANPTSLVYVSGDGQSAPAGFPLPDTLLVRLVDDNDNGVGGKPVTWVIPPGGGGSVTPRDATTNANGYASTRWTLSPSAGSNLLNAVFSGVPSVPFTATGTADVPTTIVLNGGDNQSGAVGSTLAVPLSVKVTDGINPVANVTVAWTANDGGSVSAPTSSTNASGIAQVSRTLGLLPGTYGTTAAVDGLSGSPVSFTSTATVGAAANLAFDVQPTSAGVGQTITPAVQVSVRDAQGLLVTTAGDLITLTSSLGGLVGVTAVNAVGGVATFSGLSINLAGSGFTLTAHASGLSNAISDPFDIGKSATTTSLNGDSPDPSLTGQVVTTTYSVVATSGGGTPTGTVIVSDGAGTSCSGSVAAGSCTLTFPTAGARSLTASYGGDANFASSVSTIHAHQVNKAGTTTQLTDDAPDPSVFGEPVTFAFSVTANAPGAGTPAGLVTVSGNGASCQADATVGSCSLVPTAVGSKNYTASYAGSADFSASTSGGRAHQVNQAATSTAVVSSASPTNPGDNVTFTATVTVTPPGAGVPGGQVQFLDGATQIGTSTLNVSSVATLTTSSLASGSHTITAVYLGSTNFAGSTSSSITQVVALVAVDDGYSVNQDGILSVDAGTGVLQNDTPSSGVTAELVGPGPSNGSLILNGDGSFVYTPAAAFNGQDSFTYQTTDGSLTSNTATVTITVNP